MLCRCSAVRGRPVPRRSRHCLTQPTSRRHRARPARFAYARRRASASPLPASGSPVIAHRTRRHRREIASMRRQFGPTLAEPADQRSGLDRPPVRPGRRRSVAGASCRSSVSSQPAARQGQVPSGSTDTMHGQAPGRARGHPSRQGADASRRNRCTSGPVDATAVVISAMARCGAPARSRQIGIGCCCGCGRSADRPRHPWHAPGMHGPAVMPSYQQAAPADGWSAGAAGGVAREQSCRADRSRSSPPDQQIAADYTGPCARSGLAASHANTSLAGASLTWRS
jgi:hypothetical protein